MTCALLVGGRAVVSRPFSCPSRIWKPCVTVWNRRRAFRAQAGNSEGAGDDLDAQLLADLERLKQRSAQQGQQGTQPQRGAAASSPSSSAADQQQPGALGGVKEVLDKVLMADFFFILFALGWFGAGLAQRTVTQSTGLLDSWYSLWQWVFQPALGVLMLGAIMSGLVDWLKDNLSRK